jgi:hypothetical protein
VDGLSTLASRAASAPPPPHADLLRLVADALQVRDGFERRDHEPQVARGRRARREDAAALLVDAHLHAVDLDVVLGHLEAELAVRLGQRLDRAIQLLLDEPAHREHRVAHMLEVFVEALRDVVAEILDFHGPVSSAGPGL